MYKLQLIRLAALALCLACSLAAHAQISPLGAEIAYQGELRLDGQPYNGTVDLEFVLWEHEDSTLNDHRLGDDTKSDVQVVNGLFQVDSLDFGPTEVWRAPSRWIQVTMDPGGSNEQVLWPRQRVQPAPMAWVSRNGTSGGTPWSVFNISGQRSFRVYDDGRVSIGNQIPRQLLTVGSRLDLYSGASNSPTRASIRGSNLDNLVLNSHGDGVVYFNFDSGDGGVRFHNGTGAGGEIMRIQPAVNSARVGILTDNPLSPLHVNGSTRSNSFITNTFTVANGVALCRAPSGGSQVAGLIGDCPSTARLKKDFVAIDDPSTLIAALRPVRFTWIENDQPDLGLIAEEVAEVLPELITHGSNGEVHGVNYRHLTAVLVAAWQEQQSEVLALRAELEAEREETATRLAALEALLLDGSTMVWMDR